jgi:sortase A
MSENLSSPSQPVTEPTSVGRSKLWRWFSVALTVAGLGLIAFGGWMYVRQWVEASKPPPARIVQMSPDELERTPTARPPTPTATPADRPTQPPAIVSTQHDTLPAATVALAAEQTTPPQAPTPVEPASAEISVDAQSLADNPLPVVESEPAPDGETAAMPVDSGDAVALSPLNRIVAESIELDVPIIDVGWEVVIQNTEPVNVWTVADYAAGWHRNSMMPGQGGNVVLSGHHNIKGEVFRYIVDIEPGDVITLYDESGQTFDYAVEDKFIVKDKGEPEAVRRANARWIGPFNDERLTLVTCWPYNNNTHRVIVIGKPIPSS